MFYPAIDGLRAYAAIGILCLHVFANAAYQIPFAREILVPFTHLVYLFMVISAFSMCCGYYEKMVSGSVSLEQFYGKRYGKIWPFFAMLCMIDILISPSVQSVYELLANLTLCFGFLDAEIKVIGVGWFLGLVFVFYMVFPFFCYLISKKSRAWFAFTAALMMNYLCTVYFDVYRTNIAYSAVFFFAGGLIYLYRERLETISKAYRPFVAAACLALTVAFYALGQPVLVILALFSLMLIGAIGVDGKGILNNPVVAFFSTISLEIYLSHMVVFRILEKLHMLYPFGSGVASLISACVLTLVGTIVFSLIARKLLDLFAKRIRRLGGAA